MTREEMCKICTNYFKKRPEYEKLRNSYESIINDLSNIIDNALSDKVLPVSDIRILSDTKEKYINKLIEINNDNVSINKMVIQLLETDDTFGAIFMLVESLNKMGLIG